MIVGTFILDYLLMAVKNFLRKEDTVLIFENIRALCWEKRISIARLEKECGLGNATIRGWEHSSPTIENLKRVADYFGVTVDSLLVSKEEK